MFTLRIPVTRKIWDHSLVLLNDRTSYPSIFRPGTWCCVWNLCLIILLLCLNTNVQRFEGESDLNCTKKIACLASCQLTLCSYISEHFAHIWQPKASKLPTLRIKTCQWSNVNSMWFSWWWTSCFHLPFSRQVQHSLKSNPVCYL